MNQIFLGKDTVRTLMVMRTNLCRCEPVTEYMILSRKQALGLGFAIDNRVVGKGIGNACIILASMCIEHLILCIWNFLERCTITFYMRIWIIPAHNAV